eukprot:Em0007g697a
MAAAPLRHAISAIVFSICYVTTIHAYPQGAPSGSCTALYPHHSTASQSLASSPFVLDISAFAAVGGYVQGKTYKIVLAGSQKFKGLLIQGRSGLTPVGRFTVVPGSLTKLSACIPPESAVTHSSKSLKSGVELMWTAPPKGTGDVVFHYAVVVSYDTFYATLQSLIIKESIPNNPLPSPSFSLRSTGHPLFPSFTTYSTPDNSTVDPSTSIVHATGFRHNTETSVMLLETSPSILLGNEVGREEVIGTFASEATQGTTISNSRETPPPSDSRGGEDETARSRHLESNNNDTRVRIASHSFVLVPTPSATVPTDPTQSASAEDVWAGKNKQTSATPIAEDSTRLYTFSASGDTSLNPNYATCVVFLLCVVQQIALN